MIIYFLLICVFITTSLSDPQKFGIKITDDGLYMVQIAGGIWLTSNATQVHLNGQQFSTLDGTLKLRGKPVISNGIDQIDTWKKWLFPYQANGSRLSTSIRLYNNGQVAVFTQTFLDGAANCSAGNVDTILSHFPSFNIIDKANLGVLVYGNLFAGWIDLQMKKWSTDMTQLPHGLKSGPLVLFDQSGNTLIISAFSRFTANSYVHDKSSKTVSWGIMGSVDRVPVGYEIETVLYYSDQGINEAVQSWGAMLRKYYGRTTAARDTDVTVNYIGYYTDNGGYYYRQTEPGKNYEKTFEDVISYYTKLNIPYRYLQYDDFWYYVEFTKTGYGATTLWEPMASVFPHGLQYLYETSNLPVIAHNRYWSYQTPYAKQNYGNFDFFIDKDTGFALPLSEDFWDYLFSNSLKWGLITYEQDWMNTQFEELSILQTDIYMAETWLKQMGRAAMRYNLKLQYCMTLPREIMAALEIPPLSHARASQDYVSPVQWKIGLTTLFLNSLGIAPFKDNMWTTGVQPGNPYGRTEVNVNREAIISLLTGGPVGISDRIGYTNTTIINRMIRSDGLLLKPSKPLTAIDAQVWQSAFGGAVGPVGEVYTGYTSVSPLGLGIIFASELNTTYDITPTTAGFNKLFGNNPLLLYSWQDGGVDPTKTVTFSDDTPLTLKGCSESSVCLHYASAVFQLSTGGSVCVLGELDKYVPISPQRFASVSISSEDVVIRLVGNPGEEVHVTLLINNQPIMVKCTMDVTGAAILRSIRGTCDNN